MAIKAWGINPWASVAYVASFYVCIVGAKLIIAWISDKSKNILGTQGYLWVIRILGVMLLALAVYLVNDGFELLREK